MCNEVYIGETGDIDRLRYQHLYDLRTFNQSSPLLAHQEKEGHLIKIDRFKTLKYIKDHKYRKFYESYAIKTVTTSIETAENIKLITS